MKNNIIRIGLFGASNILEKVMCEAFIKHPKFSVVGLASKSLNRLDIISKRLNCKKFNSYESLIDSQTIDAAYISLPNSMHYDISKKLLNKGIHCLVEKPLTFLEKQSKEINHIAKKSKLALVETFQFQHHSQFKYIKEKIDSRSLGELRTIFLKFGFPLFQDKENIRYKKNLNGGAFLDAGVYISKSACLLSNTQEAKVLSHINYIKGYEVDMFGSCLIATQNNTSILGSWGFDNNYACTLDLWFSKGRLTSNRIFTAKNDFSAEVKVTENNKHLITEFIDDQYYNTIDDFYLTILSQTKMNGHYDANLSQARLMTKVYAH